MNILTGSLFFLAVSLLACNQQTETDKALLAEATSYHLQATEVQEIVEPQLDRIDSLKTLLTHKPGTALTIASLDSLHQAFAEWEGNVVEVPGMKEHEHGGGEHHHHHDHTPNPLKELPADQMRDLQREMLTSIRQIQQRTQQLMKQTNTQL